MTISAVLPVEKDIWQSRHLAAVPRRSLRRFVTHSAGICLPDQVYWCDGSQQERSMLRAAANADSAPPAHPAGPASDFAHEKVKTRWTDAPEAFAPWAISSVEQRTLHELFRGCMEGRTLFAVPVITAATAAAPRVMGVQLTDSPAAALSIEQLCPNCDAAWDQLAHADNCLCLLHTRGAGAQGRQMYWFPREQTFWAYGPGYDAAALAHAIEATR